MLTSTCPGILNATDQIDSDLNVSTNQSHQSPPQRVASRSFQSLIYTGPTGECTSMLGVPKGLQQLHKAENIQIIAETFDTLPFKVIFIFPIVILFFDKNQVKWT